MCVARILPVSERPFPQWSATLDSPTPEQHTNETPEETIAFTRRLLARSRATLDGVDRRLGSKKDSETADPPTRDAG